MTVTFTPRPSLAPARTRAFDVPNCVTWQDTKGSIAGKKPISHQRMMRVLPGSLGDTT
jgi:hypothetical protein